MKWTKLISLWELLIFLACISLSLSLSFFHLKEKWAFLSYKGIRALKKKDIAGAQKRFQEALTEKPMNPWPHMNLALSYDLLKSPEKALQTYQIVSSQLKEKSSEAGFFSLFNQAELYGRQKNIDKALENYQKALEYKHKEKTIKKNIELLFKDQDPKSKKDKKDKKGGEDSRRRQEDTKPQEGEGQKEKKDKQKNQEENKDEQKNQEKTESKENQNKQKGDSPQDRERPNEEPIEESEKSEEAQPLEQKGKNKGAAAPQKLDEISQKAILEEVEKQESKARSKFFKGKRLFKDKTGKDW